MPPETTVLVLLTALCLLNGLVFVEVRRMRLLMQKK